MASYGYSDGGYGQAGYGDPRMGQPMTVHGRVLKVDPYSATKADFEGLDGLDDDMAERKLNEIKNGFTMQRENPYLPEDRPCRDCLWGLFFFLTACATLGAGYQFFENLSEKAEDSMTVESDQENYLQHVKPKALIGAGVGGAIGATAASMLFMVFANRCAACVVYTSLYFGPAVWVILGIAAMAWGASLGETLLVIVGAVLVAVGICSALCVYCCWQQYIPFMITVTECVTSVCVDHPSMIIIAVFGAVLGAAWTAACFVAFVATYLEYEEEFNDQDKNVKYVLYGFCVFVFVWGAQVVGNVCHVIYCGVFGRWYFQGEHAESLVCPSLRVALGPSFGSICLGSFLVAVIRAVEAAISMARRDAAEDGNYVMCVILCILEVIISCIGDILEYFNDWAYVQCAVRGTSFCNSARITYAMVKCSNLGYIISDLLLDSLVSMGSILCALPGVIAGLGAAYSLEGDAPVILISGAVCGFFTALMAGSAALGVISSGVKTILMCWADAPEKLQMSHPEIHDEFVKRIMGDAF